MTQCQILREFFERNANKWVSLKEILYLGIAQYAPRIKDLRDDKKNPMDIKNEVRKIEGQKRSYYRYNRPEPIHTQYQERLDFVR